MSGQARREYVQAIYHRYRHASRAEKQRILDEFCKIAGYHRKYAVRLLNGPAPGAVRPARRRVARYGPAAIHALAAIWEAAGYPWSVRLKALLPLWLPWARRRLGLARTVERQLLAISPRQMDRRLASRKRRLTNRLYGRTKPGTLLAGLTGEDFPEEPREESRFHPSNSWALFARGAVGCLTVTLRPAGLLGLTGSATR